MKKHVLVIAEAGVNHNGDLKLAKRLVDEAARSGADFVKFQTFKSERQVTKVAVKAEYQVKNTRKTESQREMLERLELSEEMHYEIIQYCINRNIGFLSTGFDVESIKFLSKIGQQLFKIPSGEIDNLPLLRCVGQLGFPVILSTGMASMGEIEAALNEVIKSGVKREDITVLQCTTEYPAPMEEVNLLAMKSIQDAFHVSVGYSDHTLGIEIAGAAVALGATVIEKHFTIDRKLPGPDHKASLEPHELSNMISAIRNIEIAMGDGIKMTTSSEKKNKPVVRKSIVASRVIAIGEEFTEDNITCRRPGLGLSPMFWDQVLGKMATRNYCEDEFIEL